jgi:predicted DNA-binding transcriptional regulator YafY
MPRLDRLEALMSLLRASGTTTVGDLAAALDVTPRTIHRDLAALRDRGAAIAGETGRGGGVRLLGDRGVTGVHLSIAEIASLWLSARLSASASQLPWSTASRSALRKLLASLTRSRALELRRVLDRVFVGPPPSPATLTSLRSTVSSLLMVVEQAFTRSCAIQFSYTDRVGHSSRRRIEPHALLVQAPLWYILAFDLDKRAPRTMRMDRIADARLLTTSTFSADSAVINSQLQDLRGQCRALSSDVFA